MYTKSVFDELVMRLNYQISFSRIIFCMLQLFYTSPMVIILINHCCIDVQKSRWCATEKFILHSLDTSNLFKSCRRNPQIHEHFVKNKFVFLRVRFYNYLTLQYTQYKYILWYSEVIPSPLHSAVLFSKHFFTVCANKFTPIKDSDTQKYK